jgi:phage shock protein E
MKYFLYCSMYASLLLINNPVLSENRTMNVEKIILEGAKIVDVRTPEEYAEGNYKGSVNIPLSDIPRRLNDFGDKKKPIIVYCRSGRRSAEAKKILVQNGFTDVIDGGALSDMPR